MALRKLMELGNLQDKTTHAVTPSKEGVGGFLITAIAPSPRGFIGFGGGVVGTARGHGCTRYSRGLHWL